jgi:hypothetical protein
VRECLQTRGGVETQSEWGGDVIVTIAETKPRSRRALLATAAAGAAVLAADQLGRPLAVRAANGGPVLLGQSNTASGTTVIAANGADALRGESPTIGVEGRTTGTTTEDTMFQDGVTGVAGRVQGPAGFGIALYGEGANGVGVLGQGGHCGVHGYGDKAGVEGKSLPGTGISGNTQDGVGVEAGVFDGGSGVALKTHGPVVFSRSGLLAIAANRSSVSKAVPALSATSMVLATLQTNRAGVYIQAAVASPASKKITIYLNKKVTAATKVAYFVLD